MTAKLALDDVHSARGAKLVEQRGWTVPLHYGDGIRELAALRSGAGLIDASDRGLVLATGPDRVEFLQGQLSNDVKALEAGQGCRATLLTRKGKMISDMVVSALEDCHVLDMEPDRAEPTLSALDRFLISEDAELGEATGSFARLVVAGPQAARIVSTVTGADAKALGAYEHHALADLHGGADGVTPRIARRDVRGLETYELWLVPEDAAALWARLEQAGATPVGREAWDLAGLEAGEARFGLDMDENSNPLEAHLQDAISYTKGCYVGQEVIAKATHVGRVGKILTGLRVHGSEPPAAGSEVLVENEPVGHVTRSALSPTLAQPIALAILKRKYAEPGTAVEIRSAEGDAVASAEVVALPFVASSS